MLEELKDLAEAAAERVRETTAQLTETVGEALDTAEYAGLERAAAARVAAARALKKAGKAIGKAAARAGRAVGRAVARVKGTKAKPVKRDGSRIRPAKAPAGKAGARLPRPKVRARVRKAPAPAGRKTGAKVAARRKKATTRKAVTRTRSGKGI
jgi:hypothetical protein